MTFDITAPIERQFTRDGRKVLAIFDSGLDLEYPISAWFEKNTSVSALTKNGNYWSSSGNSGSDIITRPEPLPLIVGFHRMFEFGASGGFTSFDAACDKSQHLILGVLKITFDPNTGTSTAETVWQKEMK